MTRRLKRKPNPPGGSREPAADRVARPAPPPAARPRHVLSPVAGGLATGLVAGCILLGIFVRVYAPDAPSPAWRYVYNTDEGHYSYCAQNKINLGRFFVNDAKYALANPLFCLLQYVCAAPWGGDEGIARYRLVSIAAGIALSLMLGLFFPPGRLRWSAVALGSLSFMGVVQSRYGIPDTLLAATMTASALLAVRGCSADRGTLLFLAGVGGVACAAVKSTGAVMLPVLLLVPIAGRRMAGRRWFFYRWILGGIAAGGLVLAVLVIRSGPATWLYFQKISTVFAREHANANPWEFAKGLGALSLSPAIHTMPILCVAALAWCAIVFVPRWIRGGAGADDALLALWLAGCVCVLASTKYLPSRWQTMLLPPLTIAGLRFFREAPSRAAAAGVLALAVALTLVYEALGYDNSIDPSVGPARGFSPRLLILTSVAALAAAVGIFLGRRFGGDWRTSLLCGAIPFELVWQAYLLGIHVVPTYRMPDQWRALVEAVRTLQGEGPFCLTGHMVQDLSLRLPMQALPTYYVLNEAQLSDAQLHAFFARQTPTPTHVLLLYPELQRRFRLAPGFMNNLEPIFSATLDIGELGRRTLYLSRVKDPLWFRETPPRPP